MLYLQWEKAQFKKKNWLNFFPKAEQQNTIFTAITLSVAGLLYSVWNVPSLLRNNNTEKLTTVEWRLLWDYYW